MKKTLLLVICGLGFIHKTNAQWVVSDPASFAQNAANQIQNMIESIEHKVQLIKGASETQKIFDQGKEWYDALKKVSNTIQNYKKVYDAVQLVYEIASIYSDSFSRMKADRNFTPEEIVSIGEGYIKLVKESSSLLDELKMGSNITEMNLTDKDRLDIINRVYDKLLEHKDLVTYYTNQCIELSYIRAKQKNEINNVLKLYGIRE